MPVLRNAVCNRQWNQTWTTSLTHRRGLRTSQRQADSKLRLARAFWTLIFCRVRLYRMSHPPAHVCTPTPVTAGQQKSARRLGTGSSWRKPFLRRPPSAPAAPAEPCAKNEPHPFTTILRSLDNANDGNYTLLRKPLQIYALQGFRHSLFLSDIN
jgi:hypothetical protein